MDIRYSCNQKDFKRYTTEEMRDNMVTVPEVEKLAGGDGSGRIQR